MANQMSNFDNFDIHQISSKLGQRWLFVCSFHCRKSFVLGSFDNAENAKRQFFLTEHVVDVPFATLPLF